MELAKESEFSKSLIIVGSEISMGGEFYAKYDHNRGSKSYVSLKIAVRKTWV